VRRKACLDSTKNSSHCRESKAALCAQYGPQCYYSTVALMNFFLPKQPIPANVDLLENFLLVPQRAAALHDSGP
jgi:hypothetical protein